MKTIFFLIGLSLFSLSSVLADSIGNRAESSFVIGKHITGGTAPMLIARPFRIGYRWDEDLEIGIEGGTSTYTGSDGGINAVVSFGNNGLYSRWFLGNSVNIYAAIQNRSLKGQFSLFGGALYTEATVAGLGATFGISNQWQMDFGMTIGIDWLFLSIPLNSTIELQLNDTTLYLEEDVEAELKKFGDAINKLSQAGAFGITIGYAF